MIFPPPGHPSPTRTSRVSSGCIRAPRPPRDRECPPMPPWPMPRAPRPKFASSDAVAGMMRREDEARASGDTFLNNSELRKSHRRVHRSRGDRHDDAAAVGLVHGPWGRRLRSKASIEGAAVRRRRHARDGLCRSQILMRHVISTGLRADADPYATRQTDCSKSSGSRHFRFSCMFPTLSTTIQHG